MADTRPGAMSRIIRWIDYRLPFVAALNHELNEYPTPRNLCPIQDFLDTARPGNLASCAGGNSRLRLD